MMQASGNDKNLLKNFNTMLSSNKSYKKPDKFGVAQFIIKHYAGSVTYDVDGFVEKNKDTVSALITSCLANSSN